MRRPHRGFTLIELLVVVSIIALLIGILLPSLRGARRSANRVACGATLRDLGHALRMYLNDSKDILPIVEYLPSVPLHDPPWPSIAETLREYVQKNISAPTERIGAFRCPADEPGATDRGPPNWGKSFFATEGSSYEFNRFVCGQNLSEFVRRDVVVGFFQGKPAEEEIWLMKDYAAFHGGKGSNQPINFLYIDAHVGDLAR